MQSYKQDGPAEQFRIFVPIRVSRFLTYGNSLGSRRSAIELHARAFWDSTRFRLIWRNARSIAGRISVVFAVQCRPIMALQAQWKQPV